MRPCCLNELFLSRLRINDEKPLPSSGLSYKQMSQKYIQMYIGISIFIASMSCRNDENFIVHSDMKTVFILNDTNDSKTLLSFFCSYFKIIDIKCHVRETIPGTLCIFHEFIA